MGAARTLAVYRHTMERIWAQPQSVAKESAVERKVEADLFFGSPRGTAIGTGEDPWLSRSSRAGFEHRR